MSEGSQKIEIEDISPVKGMLKKSKQYVVKATDALEGQLLAGNKDIPPLPPINVEVMVQEALPAITKQAIINRKEYLETAKKDQEISPPILPEAFMVGTASPDVLDEMTIMSTAERQVHEEEERRKNIENFNQIFTEATQDIGDFYMQQQNMNMMKSVL